MRLGILDMIGLAATLVFAIPVGTFGLRLVFDGRPVMGVGLLVVAALMIGLPQYLTTPQDIPGKVVEKTVGSAVKPPDDEE
ncbi:MAG: hypothetical protein ABEJ30_02875 [Halorientalis sp.]